jgi:hypothetical protein
LFGILILILAAVTYFSIFAPAAEVTIAPPTVAPPALVTIEEVAPATLSAAIVFLPVASSSATQFQVALESVGISGVELQQDADLTASDSGIFFSPQVEQAQRQQIINAVRELDVSLVATEDENAQTELLIKIIK